MTANSTSRTVFSRLDSVEKNVAAHEADINRLREETRMDLMSLAESLGVILPSNQPRPASADVEYSESPRRY